MYTRGQPLEGFPIDISIGDIRPPVRSAKRSIAGSGSKFGRLGDPQGVAVDREGRVIISDSRNHRIQVIYMRQSIVNPLRPNNDLSQTSHCKIKGLSVSEVMRIENMIIQVKFY